MLMDDALLAQVLVLAIELVIVDNNFDRAIIGVNRFSLYNDGLGNFYEMKDLSCFELLNYWYCSSHTASCFKSFSCMASCSAYLIIDIMADNLAALNFMKFYLVLMNCLFSFHYKIFLLFQSKD